MATKRRIGKEKRRLANLAIEDARISETDWIAALSKAHELAHYGDSKEPDPAVRKAVRRVIQERLQRASKELLAAPRQSLPFRLTLGISQLLHNHSLAYYGADIAESLTSMLKTADITSELLLFVLQCLQSLSANGALTQHQRDAIRNVLATYMDSDRLDGMPIGPMLALTQLLDALGWEPTSNVGIQMQLLALGTAKEIQENAPKISRFISVISDGIDIDATTDSLHRSVIKYANIQQRCQFVLESLLPAAQADHPTYVTRRLIAADASHLLRRLPTKTIVNALQDGVQDERLLEILNERSDLSPSCVRVFSECASQLAARGSARAASILSARTSELADEENKMLCSNLPPLLLSTHCDDRKRTAILLRKCEWKPADDQEYYWFGVGLHDIRVWLSCGNQPAIREHVIKGWNVDDRCRECHANRLQYLLHVKSDFLCTIFDTCMSEVHRDCNRELRKRIIERIICDAASMLTTPQLTEASKLDIRWTEWRQEESKLRDWDGYVNIAVRDHSLDCSSINRRAAAELDTRRSRRG